MMMVVTWANKGRSLSWSTVILTGSKFLFSLWSYLRGDTQWLLYTVQLCKLATNWSDGKKNISGNARPCPIRCEVESLWMLILVHTKTDFTKWKILHKNGVQCYNIDIRFSIISFYNVSKSKIHYSLFTVHLNIWTEFKINLLGILENF